MLFLLRVEFLHLLKMLELLELRVFRVYNGPALKHILIILRFLGEALGYSTHFLWARSYLRCLEEHGGRVGCDSCNWGCVGAWGNSCHIRSERRVNVEMIWQLIICTDVIRILSTETTVQSCDHVGLAWYLWWKGIIHGVLVSEPMRLTLFLLMLLQKLLLELLVLLDLVRLLIILRLHARDANETDLLHIWGSII